MLPETMKTIEMKEPGKAEVLELGSRSLPIAGPDQVLVKVLAAGVNGPDLVQRRGHYPPPKGASDLLGLEVSGEVVAVGDAVTDWNIGDTLCALTNGGGYAEYVAINADHCLPIPNGVEAIDAAGLPETFFTVWSNLFLKPCETSGRTLLVHGGAGGIGSTAIQLGKTQDMKVMTTCSNNAAMEFCTSLGADHVINYKDADFVEVVRENGGADLILDIIGGDYIARNIKAAKPDASIVQLAFNKGSKVEIELMPIMLKRLTFTGSTLRSRPDTFKAMTAASLKENVWPHFASGKLRPLTHKIFNFSQAAEAHEMMEQSKHFGKILLRP